MSRLVRFVRQRFELVADPKKAGPMAAYMKTDMPFYGIQKPDRVPVYRELKRQFAPESRAAYEKAVRELWELPHREEKYAAIQYAMSFPEYMTLASLPMYRRLIVEGAWWDFVDEVAIRIVGDVLFNQRRQTRPKMDRWIDDSNMWIRRSALISQVKHKWETDEDQLFDHCLRRSGEKEFFIRKAVGWALRDYAWTAPDRVRKFLVKHRDELSPLSFREAAKRLNIR